MAETKQAESVDEDELAPDRDVTSERSRLIRLDWERFLDHSRLEPAIRNGSRDKRRHERLVLPNVVGYLGRAHGSRPHQIANISVGGFCLLSDEPWTPGTEMRITLQREEWDGDESTEYVTVQAVVARREHREAGFSEVGFSIVLGVEESIAWLQSPYGAFSVGRKTMERFLEDLKKPRPTRLLPNFSSRSAPLPLVERTELLLEIARSHRVAMALGPLDMQRLDME